MIAEDNVYEFTVSVVHPGNVIEKRVARYERENPEDDWHLVSDPWIVRPKLPWNHQTLVMQQPMTFAEIDASLGLFVPPNDPQTLAETQRGIVNQRLP